MPWGKIDDGFYDHPKLDRLGAQRLAACGLHFLAISWCNRWLTDGHVTAERVVKLGGSLRLAALLVKVGLWDEEPDGFRVHDYLAFNRSREQVMSDREQRSLAGRAGGLAKRNAKRPASKSLQHVGSEPLGEPPSEPLGEPPSEPGDDSSSGSADARHVSDVAARAHAPSRPGPAQPIDPQPPSRRGLRSNGTNPRAEATAEAEGLRDRASKRQMAYLRGEINEAQLRDLAERDELPPAPAKP